MKYTDKNTIKNNYAWGSRVNDELSSSFDKKYRKELKNKLLKFSYKVSDKIWWKSLSLDDQESVYRDFYSALYSNNKLFVAKNTNYYKDWEVERIKILMSRYLPQLEIKRDLTIDEIIK